MSYDLVLLSPRINRDAFNDYFSGRANYEQPGRYVNAETGVYFQFVHRQAKSDGQANAEYAVFNMNFFRPHTFGLEAEGEVSAFVRAFACSIQDPQLGGMADGPYSATGFLRGWNTGNTLAYEEFGAKSGPDKILLADETRIKHAWEWNLRRSTRQADMGEDRFLPRVHWARRQRDGATIAFVAWGEGVPSAFPDCATHVMLMRKRNVSRGWLSREKKEIMESKLVPMEEIAALDGCGWREFGGRSLLFAPVDLPPSRKVIAMFADGFDQSNAIVKAYPPDHVLGKSLTAEANKGGLGGANSRID